MDFHEYIRICEILNISRKDDQITKVLSPMHPNLRNPKFPTNQKLISPPFFIEKTIRLKTEKGGEGSPPALLFCYSNSKCFDLFPKYEYTLL